MRDYFREPIPEIFTAARLLEGALEAHLAGDRPYAEDLIRAADIPAIGEWLDSIWLGGPKNPHRAIREVEGLPPILPKDQRYLPRDATPAMKKELVARDGHHCRLCGIPLIRAEVRKEFTRLYPEAARWTGIKAEQQHRGLQVMWLQYDHVVVHSRGGETTMDNIVVTCPACNFGRDRWMMEEVGIRNPIEHIRLPTWDRRISWNGLETLLPLEKRYAQHFSSRFRPV